MPKIKVKLNGSVVRSMLLKGAGAGVCMGIAQAMAEKAGPGYAVRRVDYPERSGAIVYPSSAAARADNYSNNTLEKARGQHYDD